MQCYIILRQLKFEMNNYHFYEQEAKGKYSVIFKARKKRKLDFVAIKRMQKSRKNKILNEANILTNLSHPHIIKFYEYIQSKNHMWTVSQYCPGGDLLHLIEQDKSLPENIVRGFIIEILRGLQYCHSKGVIICDLKPASILINEYGNIKLGDFGSAKTLMDLTHNQKQNKKGTPSYMAPQLFFSGGVYSFQSDLWSIGCIMYELAQGNPPFISASYQDIATLANTAKTPKVEDFSSDFNNLLEQILQKEPENRISWEKIAQHPWVGNQLKIMQTPKQPHFQKYRLQKQKQEENSKMKFLRASQELSKDTYGSLSAQPKANDKRGQFIFENDQGDYEGDFEEDLYNPDAKMELNQKQLQSAFIKKKTRNEVKQSKLKEKDREKDMLQDSSNINMFLETISRKNLTPLSEIVHHNSDNAVKPIIGNKDIEVIQSLNFNKKSLGFPYIDPQTLAQGVINGDMEEQLKQIFDGMVGDEKFNVMGYFESIIQNSDVANYLFKENFIKFYMKLMKGYKQSVLRAKIFEIMGFLVRHATVIEPAIIKYGIINSFIEGATKDKSEKVRRKAMAALGELLFYGATQVDEGVAEWDLSLSLIHSILKILKNSQQDEIVRIYCCKSIENITAQAKQVGLKFSQIDTLMILINTFVASKNEGFKASMACCFHHIIHLNASLREILLQKMGINNIIQSLKSSQVSPKTLQILLWVLITQFMKSKSSKISKLYLEDENLFKIILGKLDNMSSPVVKGRIYLYIYFYLQSDPKKCIFLLDSNSSMIAINNNKLFSTLEKQSSTVHEKQNKYEFQCIQYVLVWLYENYQSIVKFTHDDIKKLYSKIEGGYSASNLKKTTGHCGIIWHMANCPSFEDLFATQSNIQALLSILSLLDTLPLIDGDGETAVSQSEDSAISSLQSIKGIYMQILQKITNNNTISQKLQEYYATKVLPFIVGRILKSNHQDIKFNCMKFFLYLVSFFMNEDYLFDSTILNVTSVKITQLINGHLFPEIDVLLSKNINEAVPTMTMKLLAVLFQINEIFVKKFWELGKIQVIVNNGYYKQNANINVLKIVQKIVSVYAQNAQAIIPEWITQVMSISYKILVHYLNTNQQIFLEYPLATIRDLIRINGKNWSQEEINNIWQKVLSLQGHEDMIIREKAQNLIKELLDVGRFGIKGKWEIKQKVGLQNYQKYLVISGKQRDPKITENMGKIGSSRYN